MQYIVLFTLESVYFKNRILLKPMLGSDEGREGVGCVWGICYLANNIAVHEET